MKLLTTILETLSAACLVLLLLVVMLVIFKLGTWASEMSEFLLAWTVMFGGALAYATKSHLGLDILVEKFDEPTKKWTLFLSHFLILAFSLTVMVYGGGLLTHARFEMGQMMPSMQISKGWLYLSIPITGIFIALIATLSLCNVRKTNKPQSI